MSTSLLHNGFGLVGYTYVRTAYEEGKVIFTIKHERDKLHCPECGSRDLVLRGYSPRRFRMVPIGSKVIFLDLVYSGSPAGAVIRSVRWSSALPIPDSPTPRLRTVRSRALEAYDDPRRGPPSPCVLGYRQGYPEAVPQEEVLPTCAQRPQVSGHR